MAQLELHRIVTGDGKIFDIGNERARYILSTPNGMGLPPIDYQTIQFYKQDGETETGFYLEARNFSMILGSLDDSRVDLFNARRDLLNALRPNRNGQLTYIFKYYGSTIEYAIQGRVTDLSFNSFSPDAYNEHRFNEVVTFLAHDPTWFAYQGSAVAATPSTIEELVFPITFDADNIIFGSGTLWGDFSISYTGNWYAYPVIVCTGAFTTLTLTHLQTGYVIQFLGTVNAGDTLTIDLRNTYDSLGNPTGVRLYNQAGVSQFNHLSPVSDLLNFRIEPDGVVDNGLNTIQVSAQSTDGNTAFSLTYNTRFIGI